MTIRSSSTRLFPILALSAFAACATTHSDVAPSHQNPGAGEMQLPPGWTAADMQACEMAGMTGPQHKQLARGTGHWTGTSTMWMAPDTQPTTSEVTSDVSSLMDGRFMRCEFNGNISGMGPFQGLGFNGFDNVTQKYVSVWFDNCGTGFMTGDGNMSADGNTLTWNYRYTCPITKKPATLREVQRHIGDDSMTLDMYGNDPHSGKEFKMMHIELRRSSP